MCSGKKDLETLDPREYILIKGARVNNLKGIDVAIPRKTLTVITGVSGSGKSSLAFDTIYAEGQRQYVESLSSYARQFLGRMEKPEVDYIKGVSPAIAIEQKVNTRNPRSTVGTSTEIYDYLKLLFSRIGKTISPVSGQEVQKHTVTNVVDTLLALAEGTRVQVLAPLQLLSGRTWKEELNLLLQKGFTRVWYDGAVQDVESVENENITSEIFVLIDRLVIKNEEAETFRMADSVQTAFFEGHGTCVVDVVGGEKLYFSDKFELDGITFEEPSVNLFAFNNPYGACRTCEGFGHVLGIDPDKVFPDKSLSVYEGVIAPWHGERMGEWLTPLVKNGIRFEFPIHRPYNELTQEQKDLLWTGNQYFSGLNEFFAFLEEQKFKIQYRVMLSRYRGRTTCPDCQGSRLRKDAGYVKINGKSITDLVLMPVKDALDFLNTLTLDAHDAKVASRILKEIQNRLMYLLQVGLGYLTLNRLTSTLSGGEFQRIKLATSLGSALVGSMYILDEPSIGLHPRDTQQLIAVLLQLRDLGNTVIVVEHEEEIMRAADYILDIGPDAGSLGGHLVFEGSHNDVKKGIDSHTVRYLMGEEEIPMPEKKRTPVHFIELYGAKENNLKNVDIKIPLQAFSVVTGVSGSGKSTLIRKVFAPAIQKYLGEISDEFTGKFKEIKGSLKQIKKIEFVDQNPIGRSSRSNPVTYVKAYDEIRNLYATQPLSKQRGYKPAFFSFNVDGGRCEMCQGEGEVIVEMQFMADVHLTCESCGGKRFKQDVLEVQWNEKDISQVLALTIDDAITFFGTQNKIVERLRPLQEVGLGYITLGQSSSSLSGGEAQRVKLATYLGKGQVHDPTLFIFDEPTTGLHFHDISKLLKSFQALVEKGHSVVVIEHNVEVIKCADWIVDLGPEGGADGGYVVYQGTPEGIMNVAESYTGKYLKQKLS